MKYDIDRLLSANIILTNNCNSQCVSCDYWKQKITNLEVKSIEKFFGILKKYNNESIVLTGGEPSLHPNFYEIVRMAKEDYGFITILSTNGSTLNKIFSHVCDLIDSYCISFDGYNREQYYAIRGIDNYDNIIRNIEVIKEYNENIQVWLGTLIQKKNFADIEKVYNTAKKTSANGMFFNVPEVKSGCFGRENNYDMNGELLIDKSDIPMLEEILKKILYEDRERGFLCQSEEAFYKFLEYFDFMSKKNEPPLRKCFVPYNTVTLTEHGKIKPCFYIDYIFDLNEDPVNCKEMINLRRELDNNPILQKQCNYCCQFNS